MGSYKEKTYETKLQISNSLKKLLSKMPFNTITVSKVINDCHIARNTFYYHFEDITDLLRWSVKEDALSKIPQINTESDLNLLIDEFCDYMIQNRYLFKSILESLNYYDLKLIFYNDIAKCIETNVDRAIENTQLEITKEFREYFIHACCSCIAPIAFNIIEYDNIEQINNYKIYFKDNLMDIIAHTLSRASDLHL